MYYDSGCNGQGLVLAELKHFSVRDNCMRLIVLYAFD